MIEIKMDNNEGNGIHSEILIRNGMKIIIDLMK